jgi:hypothetical protein
MAVISSLLLCSVGNLKAADKLIGNLQEFEGKVADWASTAARSNDQRQQQVAQMVGVQFAGQLKQLESIISRGDYDQAAGFLGGSYAGMLPADLAKAWSELAAKTAEELKARQAQALTDWAAQVDECVRVAPDVCLGAKTSGDLDTLLVRVAALQMKRPNNSNDIVSERASRRLSSVASTLQSWMSYLDFSVAGNIKAANSALRSLSTNDSLIPVLRVSDITARMVSERGSYEAMFFALYEGIKSSADIAPALAKAIGFSNSPDWDMSWNTERRLLEALELAKEALDKGDTATAARMLANGRNNGGAVSLAPCREKVLSMMDENIRYVVIQNASGGIKPSANETSTAFEKRVLDGLYGKGDFDKLEAVMAALDDASPSKKVYTETRNAIQRFLAGQRLETANDPAFAINEYRRVLRSNGGDYAPMQQATDALKRIQAAHPEFFGATDSRVLAEVEALRQDVQQVLSRASAVPGYPPFRR